MTEQEWLAAEEPMPLVLFLRDKAPQRHLRLFACACCRSISETTRSEEFDSGYKSALAALEEYSDGSYSADDYWIVQNDVKFLSGAGSGTDAGRYVLIAAAEPDHFDPAWVVQYAIEAIAETNSDPPTMLTGYLRDIFGNPFRPLSFSPEWRTTTTVAIAQSMYESRDFGSMPLLADALQDAGCEVPEILDHCRGPGPHVRGCWVVDGVLGKE